MVSKNQSDGPKEEEVSRLLINGISTVYAIFMMFLSEIITILIVGFVNNPYFSDESQWKVKYDKRFEPVTTA